MTSTATARHVAAFLLTLDAPGRFLRAARAFARKARTDPAADSVLAPLAAWVDGAAVDVEGRAIYRRLHPHLPAPLLGETPEATTLLGVAYLWVTDALPEVLRRGDFDEAAGRAFTEIPARLDALEDDFVGELLVETELRAARDRRFAARLDAAVEELRSLVPELEEIGNPLPFPARSGVEPTPGMLKPPDLEENFVFYVLVGVAIVVVAVAGKAIESSEEDG